MKPPDRAAGPGRARSRHAACVTAAAFAQLDPDAGRAIKALRVYATVCLTRSRPNAPETRVGPGRSGTPNARDRTSDYLGTPAVLGAAPAAWARHLGSPAPTRSPGPARPGSIPMAAHGPHEGPSRAALEIDGDALTHGELDERAARMAGWLHQRGLEPGDVVLITSPSSGDGDRDLPRSLRAGATALLANPAYTEAELDHLAGDGGAVVALAARPGHCTAPGAGRPPSADQAGRRPPGARPGELTRAAN